MHPTLNANGATEFGIVDNHKLALDNLKRFDIVTTYYPMSYNGRSDYCYIEDGREIETDFTDTEHTVQLARGAEYKIKRLLALPGEQFYVTETGVVARSKTKAGQWGEWTTYDYPFTHADGSGKTFGIETAKTLEKDEYWVIGDNWRSSTDCATMDHPVYRANIQGVLIAIEGTCIPTRNATTGQTEVTHKKYYSQFRYFKR